MANDWNNVKPVGCKPWLVLPAVYSDALSYGDQIAHFCAALNKLIQNNNTLPEYIQQMIQDYINGDVIGEVVQNIVSQFILNVKYPPENLKPAVGDGSADDTEAIQGCINYAKNHNGMAVYIPSGAYSVQSLTLPGDVSLFGFDRYTTKLVLRGGATTPMISSTGTGFSIVGLTLDGNAGVQVENIGVLSLISQDVLLRDLIVQNGYKLLVYNGTGGHLQVNDVVFGSAVIDCVEISGGSAVQFKNCQFTNLSQVSGSHIIDISSDGGEYDFINNAVCPTCCIVSGNDNFIQFTSSGAQNNFSDTGLRNNIIVNGQEVKEYLSNDFNSTIEGSYGQNVNGAYSENISGAFTSVRNGTESKTVTNASIKNYNNSQTENITNKKTINAKDIFLNPTNPLQYKTPTDSGYYSTVPFKDDSSQYNVLVENEYTQNLFKSLASINGIKGYSIGYYDTGIESQQTQENIVFILPNNKVLQLDFGWKYENEVVKQIYNTLNITKIDYIYISHFDSDHVGNMEYVLSFIDANEATIFLPQLVDSSKVPESVITNQATVLNLASLYNMSIVRPHEKESFDIGGAEISFYNTLHDGYYASSNFKYNNCSLCALLKYGLGSVFLSGDIEEEAQEYLSENAPNAYCLKMSHHGANTSYNMKYFFRISPYNFFVNNGRGYSNSGYSNYFNLYSGENKVAQQYRIPVYATSNSPSYILPMLINSFGVWFSTPAITNDRYNNVYNAMVDITGKPATMNSKTSIKDFIDIMDKNSKAVFCSPGNYQSSVNEVPWIIDVLKSNSTSSFNGYSLSDENAYYARAIYTQLTSLGAGESFILMSNRFLNNSDVIFNSVSHINGPNYYRHSNDSVPIGSGANLQIPNIGSHFGDDFKIEDGVLKCKKTGIYKFSLYFHLNATDTNNYALTVKANESAICSCVGKGSAEFNQYDFTSNSYRVESDSIISIDHTNNVECTVVLLIELLSYLTIDSSSIL